MISPEALTLLKTRYLRENESPEDMFWRVATHVAQAEEAYGQDKNHTCQQFYELLAGMVFLPNSPTLMNAGKKNAQLAACFVLPIEDSLADIFETLKNTMLIHHSGGGTGFSFSRLRPKNDAVSSNGAAGGPLSFMRIYDAAADVVKQGAVRSGANMAVLRVDHPDIIEFITTKRKHDRLNNFNLSVGITDEFMRSVHEGRSFNLINPRTKQTAAKLEAKRIFDLIVQMAWENGEPGLFFLDNVNKANPTPELGEFEAPNPCSEQPLLPYESCTLGSINLTKMIKLHGGKKQVDYFKLKETVRTAVRFLDDVIDVNSYPLEIVERSSRRTRKIGLGIMGLADMFIMLDLPYASPEAVRLTAQIMGFITSEGRKMSSELALKRGNFPAFYQSIFAGSDSGYSAMRNATITTVAPTGSISIIANCSSGIEPLFALAMTRRVLEGHLLSSLNENVLKYLEERKLLNTEIENLIKSEGSIQTSSLPVHNKNVLAVAHEIKPYWHVAQLAAAQKHTDNGVSKTVNLPSNATTEDVAEVFWHAYSDKCKGVTVYRHLSRNQQVLTQGIACPECSI